MSAEGQNLLDGGESVRSTFTPPTQAQLKKINEQLRTTPLPVFNGSAKANAVLTSNSQEILQYAAKKDFDGLKQFLTSKGITIIPPDMLALLNYAQSEPVQGLAQDTFGLVASRENAAKAFIQGAPQEQQATAVGHVKNHEKKWAQRTGQKVKNDLNILQDINRELALQSGISTEEAIRKYGEALNEAARLAGFTSFLSSKATPAPGTLSMETQFARNFLLALTYELEKERRKIEEALAKPKDKEPAAARAEKPEREAEKSNLTEQKIAEMLKDLANTVNKSAAAAPAAEKAVAQQRMEKEKAPEKEVGTPPSSGGAMAAKTQKEQKAPKESKEKESKKPKPEPTERNPTAIAAIKVENPTKKDADTAKSEIVALERKYALNDGKSRIEPGRFEREAQNAIKSGDTKSLKAYFKLLTDTIAMAAKAVPGASKKQGMA
jgi:hypothetical protein